MPHRKHSAARASEEYPPPLSAERQAEVEQILKLRPGDLSPERVALRAQVADARLRYSLRSSYHDSGIDTYNSPHPTQQRRGEKEKR
jgi:hypothetical protein